MRTFLFGMFLGAIAGVLYAPATGNRTRALVRDKYTHYSNETAGFIDRHGRDLSNRMEGVRHNLNTRMEDMRGRYGEISALVSEQTGPLKEKMDVVREDMRHKLEDVRGRVENVRGRVEEKMDEMKRRQSNTTNSEMISQDGTDQIRRSA
jgi:gas vesicle protein